MSATKVTPIYVGSATDNNYVQHCAVTLFSLCKNNSNRPIKLYLLTPGLTRATQKKLSMSLAGFGHVDLSFINVDDRLLCELDNGFQGRIGKANYYRLLLPKLLGKVTDKLLYIDADVVIEDNIELLWNTDINLYCFAAVENPWHCLAKRHEGTGLLPHAPYFNSGVMLLNLRRLAGMDLIRRLVEIKSDPHLHLMPGSDMDALNAIFKNAWLKVDPKWNVMGTHFFLARFYGESNMPWADYRFTDSPQAICAAVATPAIIHYTGCPKPWEAACAHPRADLYWQYLRQTPWHDARAVQSKRWVLLREHLTKVLVAVQRFLPVCVKNWLIAKAYRMPGAGSP